MTDLPYDLTPYTDPVDPHVWCTVRWRWRATGETIGVVGDYLNIEDGLPVLCCGIYQAAEDMGLPDEWLNDDAHCLQISDLVDRQLALQPRAELRCPQGVLRIDLVSPRSSL